MYKILQAEAPGRFRAGDRRKPAQCANSSRFAFAETGDTSSGRQGIEETGIDGKTGNTLVRIDPVYFRPTEVTS